MTPLARLKTAVSPAFAANPEFQLNPSGLAPLAGLVMFETTVPTVAEISVSDGEREWPIPSDPTFRWNHRYRVLGMRADKGHRLTIKAKDRKGSIVGAEHVIPFRTDPLLADFPALETRISDIDRMEPGVTFFGIRKSASSGAKSYGMLVAVDEEGEVVWYRDVGYTTGDIKRLRNGNFIYLSFDRPSQPVDATHALNRSAGVSNSNVLRGRSLSCRATLFRCACEYTDKSVPLGKYCRSRPLVFSLDPRCHGLRGSQK